jgi:uracil-DNA glycosylase family 4
MKMNKIPQQRDCDLCGLSLTRTQVVVSDGAIKPCRFVVVGEGPGADEDRLGVPFVGRSGKLLREFIERYIGLKLGKDIVVLNAVSCRPPDNRVPKQSEVEACNNWLRMNLAIIGPDYLLAVGKTAASSFIKGTPQNGTWYKDDELKKQWRDNRFHFSVLPIWHPAYILRNKTVEVQARWVNQMIKFHA